MSDVIVLFALGVVTILLIMRVTARDVGRAPAPLVLSSLGPRVQQRRALKWESVGYLQSGTGRDTLAVPLHAARHPDNANALLYKALWIDKHGHKNWILLGTEDEVYWGRDWIRDNKTVTFMSEPWVARLHAQWK